MDVVLTLTNARAFSSGILGRPRKFSKLDVSRLYFGNWLRDYSQAVDVASVRFMSAEAVVLVVWILGFMSFGYGTGEFEVTKERLGVYIPAEHVDNPRGYADGQDARQYDPRLRGPVDERRELSVDPRTGMKNYIANEDIGIATSSRLCKDLLQDAIEVGRRYKRSNKSEDYFEALRLLGTACHCLEDFLAHSNYAELALLELGERNVFAHVGDRTQLKIAGVRHPVYPVTTGTFGGVDFLHSVMGGFTDKMEASEIGDLGDIVAECQKKDTSTLKGLLMKLPSGIFSGRDSNPAQQADQLQANAQAQQMADLSVSPRDPKQITTQMENLRQQIYPILEFHDRILKAISSAISKIPILPDLLDKLSEQLNIWVFSLIAPFILPIIRQVKAEVEGGSSAVIKSSKDAQHIVFNDPYATDPTHSMLSKDHFSNVLNEPCGRAAMDTVAWIVPQIVDAWDDDKIDSRRVAARVVAGVFHHPAQRGMASDASDGRVIMFSSIENWWRGLNEKERQELRGKLSREGVRASRHHKDGVHDCGHGGGKPLGMPGVGAGARPQHRPPPQSMPPNVSNSGGQGGRTSSPARIQEALGGGALGAAVDFRPLAGGLTIPTLAEVEATCEVTTWVEDIMHRRNHRDLGKLINTIIPMLTWVQVRVAGVEGDFSILCSSIGSSTVATTYLAMTGGGNIVGSLVTHFLVGDYRVLHAIISLRASLSEHLRGLTRSSALQQRFCHLHIIVHDVHPSLLLLLLTAPAGTL
ncbi:hypothetical protein BST61_g7918 [Cercospora zeina]